MKKVISLLVTLVVLFSCSKDNNSDPKEEKELQSKWQLIETYFDIGDGNGEFHPVKSDLTIYFYDDGTLTASEPICNSNPETDEPVSGTYSSENTIITLTNCIMPYEIDGTTLILNYPFCVEPCFWKFTRIR